MSVYPLPMKCFPCCVEGGVKNLYNREMFAELFCVRSENVCFGDFAFHDHFAASEIPFASA